MCVEGRDRRCPRGTLDEMVERMPEVALLPDELSRFTEVDRTAFEAFAQVPAVRHGRIEVIDAKLICWYWSRLEV